MSHFYYMFFRHLRDRDSRGYPKVACERWQSANAGLTANSDAVKIALEFYQSHMYPKSDWVFDSIRGG